MSLRGEPAIVRFLILSHAAENSIGELRCFGVRKKYQHMCFPLGKCKQRNQNLLTQGHSRSEAGKGLETQI